MSKEVMERVRAHWENPATVSLADDNLRRLETEKICSWLDLSDDILDLGCGDGINSLEFARHARRLLGVDYSSEMVRKARARQQDAGLANLEFRQLAVQDMNLLREDFSLVISQRCLINLPSFAEQEAALKTIAGLLRPGGRLLLLECVEEGRQGINRLREKLDLPPLQMPWHNCFFREEQLKEVLESNFQVLAVEDFSLYYLFSRVFNPAINPDHTSPASKQVDQAAHLLELKIGSEIPTLAGLGPQRLFVLRKLPS